MTKTKITAKSQCGTFISVSVLKIPPHESKNFTWFLCQKLAMNRVAESKGQSNNKRRFSQFLQNNLGFIGRNFQEMLLTSQDFQACSEQ